MDKTTGEYDFTRLETVVFGVGKVEALGRELSRRGAKRALIVTGKTLGQSKLLDQVKSAAGNALAGVFTGAAQHVPSQTVTELVAEARRVGADGPITIPAFPGKELFCITTKSFPDPDFVELFLRKCHISSSPTTATLPSGGTGFGAFFRAKLLIHLRTATGDTPINRAIRRCDIPLIFSQTANAIVA
jgi:hypothetical protein